MKYITHGMTSLYEILGDFLVYRNLIPSDRRLPALGDLRERLGLNPNALPRKAEPAYGLVIAEMLRLARNLKRPGSDIQRLLYIGDTRLNDGAAFTCNRILLISDANMKRSPSR